MDPAATVAAPPSPSPSRRVPSVLLLHGTACNARVLRTQLRWLLQGGDDDSERARWAPPSAFAVEGALQVPALHPTAQIVRAAYGPQTEYLQYLETAPFDASASVYGGLDAAVAHVRQQVRICAPTAVVGFSQGALLATLLAARAVDEEGEEPPGCLVLFNPPDPRCLLDHAAVRRCAPLPVPVLVCHGRADAVVGDAPQSYGALFARVHWLTHTGGHQPLPSDEAEARKVAADVRRFVASHVVNSESPVSRSP